MKKYLADNKQTQAQLNALPTVYIVDRHNDNCFVNSFPFGGKFDKHGMPLVYYYWDANGETAEWILSNPNKILPGHILFWTFEKDVAHVTVNAMNKLEKDNV